MQPRGARAQRAVDEQIAGQPAGAGAVDQSRAWPAVVTRLTPVADDLDAVVGVSHVVPVVEAADVGAGAFVHRDDAERGRGVERGQPGLAALRGRQQVAGGRAHQVVGVAGQRPLRGEPAASARPGRQSRSAVDAAAEWTSTRAR